jgi:putative membrane protein
MSELHSHSSSWFVLSVTSILAGTALVYVRGWVSFRRAFPSLISGWRLAAFLGGLTLVWTAVASPFAALDHQLLTIHMMKHLLLMTVAAPLILAGRPMLPLACGLPKLFIRSHPPVASLPARWLEYLRRHPAFCWLAGTATVIGWHLPAAFQSGMRSHGMHILEDISFLAAGLLFWWPVMQSSPRAASSSRWSIALYLFLATLPCDILSAFLVFCNRLVYPFYSSTPHQFSFMPQADQECAGALMWVWVTFAYLIPAVILTIQLLSPSNSRRREPIQAAQPGLGGSSRSAAEAEVL